MPESTRDGFLRTDWLRGFRFFARQGFQVFGIDSNHRAVFFGPEGDTSWVLDRLRREIPGLSPCRLSTSATATACWRLIEGTAARPDHPHRRAALARPRRRDSVSRFRSQRAGHAEPAGSGAAVLPGIAVHPHVDQQGLRRPAQHRSRCKELETRWDYDDPAYRERHPRRLFHRPVQAFAVRRVQSRRRRDGAGIRPLFQHAHLLPARRLPHRARTTPASNCTAS